MDFYKYMTVLWGDIFCHIIPNVNVDLQNDCIVGTFYNTSGLKQKQTVTDLSRGGGARNAQALVHKITNGRHH